MHRVAGKKLNRNTKQRKALFKGLANSVIIYEKVETTEAKAKAVKPFIEKLVTKSKENSVNSRRELNARLGMTNAVDKLLEVVGPTFKDRPGGYLRITKLNPRAGDSAKMAVIEFVEEVSAPKKVKTKQQKTEKTEQPKSKTKTKNVAKESRVEEKNKPSTKVKNEKTKSSK